MKEIVYSILGIFFIFLMTTLGSVMVFVKNKKNTNLTKNLFLGFAGGVMLAASFFSLILPSFEYANITNVNSIFPAVGGIVLGALFILIFDLILSKQSDNKKEEYRNKKMFVAVTLHNIPEGLSVGLSFGLALNGFAGVSILSALLLAFGIGIQNFPEGAALALPLYESTKSKKKAFLLSVLSGIVEPIFAILGLLLASKIVYVMPWALCFGAGAMIYVIIDELIIYTSLSKEKRLINLSFILGFLLMMTLDLCL